MKFQNSAHPAGLTRGQYRFAQAPQVSCPRSQITRSSGHRTAFYAGYLVPIYVDEALPGDTWKMKSLAVGRMATAIYPVMDNIYLDTFWFAVPYRLVWDNWAKFNGEQANPGDSTDYTVPIMTETVAEESLSDYMGLPINVADLEFNSLWHRAYNLIFREWFRSQDLQDSPVVDTDDGPDDPADYVLRRRCKRHDYFTSCLPFVQKGDPVSLPLGTSAPVESTGDGIPLYTMNATGGYYLKGTAGTTPAWSANPGGGYTAFWDDPKLIANLSGATAATINDLRQAFQIQRMLERDARGGSRYTEILKSHFGVTSPDQRLQRPEYLGGGTSRVNYNPVPMTLVGVRQLADLGAFGTVTNQSGFMKSFTEHCLILGLANVRADITYQQGLPRMFSRQTRHEFYWPSLANLGEQAVLNKEIYCDGSANDDLVFGYQERYAEYRYKPSHVTGVMRSTHSTPLDAWHLALDFPSLPTLNDVFIEDTPPMDRISAVANQPDILADFYFGTTCARPMPLRSIPGMIDHF